MNSSEGPREPLSRSRIEVAMGDCGLAAGAHQAFLAILDEVKKRGLHDLEVIQTDCIGHCEHEPIVVVTKPNQPQIVYGHVTPERARQIVSRHIVNNQVTGEWVVAVS